MTDANDVQALENISNAVDESQLKIILTSQCIKAQSLLVAKLRKQSEQQKEVCNFINSGNLKLETEIRIAEHKVKSMITALETIKSSNVDLQKELLLAKERKSEVTQRVNNGIKKYEDLWQEAKTKYESIPFIKHYLQTKYQTHAIKQNINSLINDSQKLTKDINEKRNKLADLDKSRILEMANYLINERPKTLLLIKQKYHKIDEFNKEIGKLTKNNDIAVHTITNISKEAEKSNSHKINIDENREKGVNIGNDSVMLPKLELCYIDLDLLANKLDKIKKADSFSMIPTKVTKPVEQHPNTKRREPHNDYKMMLIDNIDLNKPKNYSEKKLIHILDDIKINDNEAKDLLSKVKQDGLKDVNLTEVIVSNKNKDNAPDNKDDEITEDIEEIDLTPKKSSIIGPPSQFLDLTEPSQKNDIIIIEESPIQTPVTDLNNSKKSDDENKGDEADVQLNTSGASDISYQKIKDSILKKHKLDLSPQFVYSKKPMTHNMRSDEVIKSKFFDDKNDNKSQETSEILKSPDNNKKIIQIEDITKDEGPNNAVPISPKINVTSFEQKDDTPISGFLFNHGADGIIQLSNTSLNTTGYGDGENDFPHCIDSSLLLSPKADLEIQDTNENDEQVLSQEVPNFLSGLRKTGYSFFGSATSDTATTSDTSTKTQQSNFNFNFGGGEKKTRGGLFSMFR